MIRAGERIPSARVWAPATDGAETTLAELAAAGPLLLLFYLYDWTGT
ncbi:MAG: hypothetical protein IT201_01850 [Thermoleophilia bacterium]|nr:hypothetical protein [Thermoleophilia bacterium]